MSPLVALGRLEALMTRGLTSALEDHGIEVTVLPRFGGPMPPGALFECGADVLVLDENVERDAELADLRAYRQVVGVVLFVAGPSPLYREFLLEAGLTPISRGASVAEIVAAVRATSDVSTGPTPGPSSRRVAGGLTVRERGVLSLLVRGVTYREIGERLHIAPETARTHTRSVCRKLNVRDKRLLIGRVDLVS